MFKTMMNGMKEMKGMMESQTASIQEAKDDARSAKQAATEAKLAVSAIEHDVQKLKDTAITKDQVEDNVKASMPKIEDIESEISRLRGAATLEGSTSTLTMGGFQGTSYEAAALWVEKALGYTYTANVFMMEQSTDNFKGLLFIKFQSPLDASKALTKLKEATENENRGRSLKKRIWVEFKAPIEKRVARGFVFGLRRQLMEWEFPSICINVEKDTGTLQVNKKDVVKAEVRGDEFTIEWLDPAWASWDILQQSKELEGLIKTSKDRLASSRASTAKGAGKGPHQ